MKVNYLTLLAATTTVLLSAAARGDDSAVPALAANANVVPPTQAALTPSTTAGAAPANWLWSDTATYDADSDPVQDFIVRAGAWAAHASGSPTKVDQYDNRKSSPFFDVAGIFSNGEHTVDLDANGTDDETDNLRVHYFGQRVEGDVFFERFQNQLYENTYPGFGTVTAPTPTGVPNTYGVYSRDNLNPGQDYAIRVQEWRANFHGQLTDNLKWYVNTFGMEKTGERQANGFAHCFEPAATTNAATAGPPGSTTGQWFNGVDYAAGSGPAVANKYQCHVVSQAQHIDWQTTEVEPGLEWRAGALTVNYSHMIRVFQQNDQQVYNLYNNSATTGLPLPAGALFSAGGYDIVPNSETQIDRLKAHAELGYHTDAYAMGYAGDTEDELNQMDRHMEGGDLRITNRSIQNLTVTGFGRAYSEHTDNQKTILGYYGSPTGLYPSEGQFYQQNTLPTAITSASEAQPQYSRDREAVGFDGRWLPFGDDGNWALRHFAVTGGYEYATEHYQNDTLYFQNSFAAPYHQPDTVKNTASIGLEEKWSQTFMTFIRYKWIGTHYPLMGVTTGASYSVGTDAAAVDTALPTLENRVEVGGTWTPTDTVMVNAEVYLETASMNGPNQYVGALGPYEHFDSNSYPYVLSAWWSPAPQWSLNAGFAQMNSWINQDLVQSSLASATAAGLPSPPIPGRFNDQSDVFNVGARYLWTPKLSTCANFEYVHAYDGTSIPLPSTGNYGGANAPVGPNTNVGQYSLVDSNTIRLMLGVDYLWRPQVSTFARYVYNDYQDNATGLTSGSSNFFLVGASAKF